MLSQHCIFLPQNGVPFLPSYHTCFLLFSLRFSIRIPARNKKYIGYQRPSNIDIYIYISIDKVSNIIQYPYLRYSHVPFNLSEIIPHPATFRRSRCSRSRNCRTCPKRWVCRVYQLRWPLGLMGFPGYVMVGWQGFPKPCFSSEGKYPM